MPTKAGGTVLTFREAQAILTALRDYKLRLSPGSQEWADAQALIDSLIERMRHVRRCRT